MQRSFGFATSFKDTFLVGQYLGSGSFASVHVAQHKQTGDLYAVKTIKKRFLGGFLEHHFQRRVQREVDIYQHMGSSLNIAHLHGAYEDDKCVELVLQLCTGGELWSRIQRGAYGEWEAAHIITEVLRAVAQCHARGVVLRDVKPENFLFLSPAASAPLKMIDFGMADYCAPGQQLRDRAGSPVYCAPEVLRNSYGQKADVWSAGIIAYQLLTARLPFLSDDGAPLFPDLHMSASHRELFCATLSAPLDFSLPPWPALSPGSQDLVSQLLRRDAGARPSAAEALAHPWLQQAQQLTPSPATCPDGRTHAADSGGLSWQTSSRQGGTGPMPARPPSQSEERARSRQGSTAGSVSPALTPPSWQAGSDEQLQPLPVVGAQAGSSQAGALLDDTLVQRLQRYGTYARLKQVALSKVASFSTYLGPSLVAELQQALAAAGLRPVTPRTPSSPPSAMQPAPAARTASPEAEPAAHPVPLGCHAQDTARGTSAASALSGAESTGSSSGSRGLGSSGSRGGDQSTAQASQPHAAAPPPAPQRALFPASIPFDQVVAVLKDGRFELSDTEITQLLASFHIDEQGCIDAFEWVAALMDWSRVQDTPEWDALVSRVFGLFDVHGSGVLRASELEALLCDPEAGCAIPDTVPAALRAAHHDSQLEAGASSQQATDATCSLMSPGTADSHRPLSPSTQGVGAGLGETQGRGQSGSAPAKLGLATTWGAGDGDALDLPAFARLLRSAHQDRLELFESRLISRVQP